jgi:hypothetical protein
MEIDNLECLSIEGGKEGPLILEGKVVEVRNRLNWLRIEATDWLL